MTKVELIAAVANEANLTKKDAEAAVNGALNAITNALKEGDKVKKGQLLLEMDLDKIAAAKHPAVVITVITNTDEFAAVEGVASGTVEPGADLLKISK